MTEEKNREDTSISITKELLWEIKQYAVNSKQKVKEVTEKAIREYIKTHKEK